MEIFEKLMAIQNELKAPKNQRNTFGNYNYRSAEDILEAVKPLLYKYKTILYIVDEPIMVGDWHYIKATATFICCETGKSIFTVAYAREELTKKGADASQITGATSSYARKYALNGLFCIDDNKDSDATNNHGKGDTKPPQGKGNYQQPGKTPANPPKTAGNAPVSANVITLEQCKALAEIGKQKGLSREEMSFIAWSIAGVSSAKEIPQDKYNAVAVAMQDAVHGNVYKEGQ